MASKKIKLAVFDIDGTIFRSSLLIELFNGFVERGIFPKKAQKEILPSYMRWLNRKGSYGDYIGKVVRVYLKYIRGITQAQVDASVKHIIEQHKDRIYRYTRNLILQCKKKGYMLIAISGSPQFVVTPFARYLGFDHAFGTVFEVKKDKYTGRRFDGKQFDFGVGVPPKELTFREFLKMMDMDYDKKNSIAVGDTESDIPLLELVGKPIAFNPNSELVKAAQKKKWKIVVERKDVVYEASSSDIIRTGS